MAEERPAEAAGHRPAIDIEAGVPEYHIRIKIDNPWLAGLLGFGALSLGAFYLSRQALVESAVRSALAGLGDGVQAIRPSSILVELVCYTKERFLAFMDAFEVKIVKQRLQDELSKIGFKDELEVTIVNEKDVYDNASRIRRGMMTGAAASPMKSVKSGKPEDDDLVELAFAIEDKWETLGRRLGVSEPILNTIALANQELTEKGYNMLREWKQRGSAATYEALYHALKHERVGLPDLAEKFCSDG